MILGLSGYKGSGKDTVAAYLVKNHGFERKAFADPLKLSVAALFDIPFHEVDKLKNDPIIGVSVGSPTYKTRLTFREFLQRFGTEAHRDIFGDDFWVDQTLPVQGFYPGRAIVITDCRFENEANRIKSLGGYICRVYRKSAPREATQHRSENQRFPTDFDINNDGTLDELYKNIEEVLSVVIDVASANR